MSEDNRKGMLTFQQIINYCNNILLSIGVWGASIIAFSATFTGIRAPPRDYSIPGTDTSKIFTTIGAMASLVFAFNTGMLPEIQVQHNHDEY